MSAPALTVAQTIMALSPLSARKAAAESLAEEWEEHEVTPTVAFTFEDGSRLRLGLDGHLGEEL